MASLVTTTVNGNLTIAGNSASDSHNVVFSDTGGEEWYIEYNGGLRFVESGAAQRFIIADGGNATLQQNLTINTRLTFSGGSSQYLEVGTNSIALKNSGGSVLWNSANQVPASGGTFTGDITISKSVPKFTLVNTSASSKTWDILGNGSSFYITEASVADRLLIQAGGNVTFTSNVFRVQSASSTDMLVRINSGSSEVDSRLMLGEADNYGMTFEYDGLANMGYLGMNNNVAPTGAWSKRIQMSRGGTEVAFMAGRVGIGTASPAFPFEIRASNLTNGDAKRVAGFFDTTSSTTGTGGGIALGGWSNGGASPINDFAVIQGIKENATAGNYASAMLFSTRANGATPAEQMRITSAGSVGIGTNNPDVKLSVRDSTADLQMRIGSLTAGRDAKIRLQGKNTANSANRFADIGLDAENGLLQFWTPKTSTPSVVAVSINSSANVGIGTDNPGSLLTVSGNSDNGDSACTIAINDEDSTGGSKIPAIQFYGGGTTQGRIRGGDTAFQIAVGSSPTTALNINTTNGYPSFTYGSQVRLTLGSTGAAESNTANWVRANGANLEFNAASGDFNWEVGGTHRMRLTDGGVLGVGLGAGTDPFGSIHANGTNGGIYQVTRTSGSTTGTLGIVRFGNTDIDSNLINIKGVQDGATDSARLEFQTQPTGGSTVTRMSIKSNGETHIGSDAQGVAIHGNTSGYGSIVGVSRDGSSYKNLEINGATVELKAAGALIMTVGSGGVGIGMSPSSTYRLAVTGTNNTPVQILSTANSCNLTLGNSTQTQYTNILFNSNSGNAQIWKAGGSYSGYGGANSLNIYCSNGKIAFHPNAAANKVVIDTNGYVGIGTNAPGQLLHVQGATSIVHVQSSTANANASIWFNSNVSGTQANRWEIGTNISRGASLEIFDRLNSVSRLELTNTGDLLLGGDVSLTKTVDSGTGALIQLKHFRSSGATGYGDDLGTIDHIFKDSAGNEDVGVRMVASMGGSSGDNTHGSESTKFKIQTLKDSGTLTDSLVLDDQGVTLSGLTTLTTNGSGYALKIFENSGGEYFQLGVNQYGGLEIYNETTKCAEWYDTGDFKIPDNIKILLGTGDDLQIYHDGSNSYVQDTGTGDLILKGDNVRIKTNTSNDDVLRSYAGGAVELYYNDAKKFETTNTGATVSGDVSVTRSVNGGLGPTLILVNDPGSSTAAATESRLAFAPHHSGTETASIRGIAENTGAQTKLSFYTHNGSALAEKMVITADGNVGIGTNNPSAAYGPVLHVRGTNPVLRLDGTGANSWAWITMNTATASEGRAMGLGADGSFRVTANSASMDANIQLHITQAGAVTFNNAFTFPTSDGSAGQVLQTNGSGTVTWATVSGGGGSGTVTEVTVGTGLDVSSGTTTPNITLDFNELATAGTVSGSDDFVVVDGTSTRKEQMSSISLSGFSGYYGLLSSIYKNNGTGGSITPDSSGYMYFYEGTGIGLSFSGNSITFSSSTGSDYRLKKNISTFNSEAWTKVKGVNLRKFDFDEDAFKTAIASPDREITEEPKNYTDNIGFIAHELAEAGIQGSVIGDKDAVDEDGNFIYQKVNYIALVPVLWGALKEAISKIETLESKVQALEDK